MVQRFRHRLAAIGAVATVAALGVGGVAVAQTVSAPSGSPAPKQGDQATPDPQGAAEKPDGAEPGGEKADGAEPGGEKADGPESGGEKADGADGPGGHADSPESGATTEQQGQH